MSFHAFATGHFRGPNLEARCVLGRGGVCAARAKSEGDGASPAGVWPMRRVLYRPDREPPPATVLSCAALSPDDGWCDAPADPAYNRPVKHPYPASAERLWREDHAYDLIVVLGFNDAPPAPYRGSAIFLHLAQPDWRPTEGCVAVTRETMLTVLAAAAPDDTLAIVGV
ncbi:MAG TPA: L,D-transpeptidase family protein [Caulobacterales bacterium]|nr:L,D-transpeptidase family protein [Caulobacterales bacterium]